MHHAAQQIAGSSPRHSAMRSGDVSEYAGSLRRDVVVFYRRVRSREGAADTARRFSISSFSAGINGKEFT